MTPEDIREVLIVSALVCMCLTIGSLSVAEPDGIGFASQHPNSIVITLSTDKPVYKLGSEILVSIQKKNISSIPLQTNVLTASIDNDLFLRHGSIQMQPLPTSLRNSPIVEAPHRPYQLGPGALVTDPGSQGAFTPISVWGLKIVEPGTYVLTATSHDTNQKSNEVTITVSSGATPSAVPQPDEVLFKAIPAASIPNNRIDAHIPRNTDPIDREIVREVMTALPPTMRQFIVWFHVPPGKPGYEELPNHGLMVQYYGSPDRRVESVKDLPGLYVLYFDGKVQLDANIIYESGLDHYLVVVPHAFSWYSLNGEGQPTPLPSAPGCSLFRELYPPTEQAFNDHHLTRSQRTEILKWIKKIPSKDSSYARWMRPGWKDDPDLILVFNTKPVVWVAKPGHSVWQALNSNIIFDPTTCEIHAHPTA